jgi:lysophospholipase L1-like esterase
MVAPERPAVEGEAENQVTVHGEVVRSPKTPLLSRPALAAITVLVLAAVAHFAPGLERVRLFAHPPSAPVRPPVPKPVLTVGEATLQTESREQPGMAQPENVELPTGNNGPIAEKHADLTPIDVKKPPVPIIDPSSKALDGFYESLYRTAQKQPHAITRVIHFGDSIVTSDYVSGTLRRKLQKQFGDAGHGFSLIANAWPAYFHNDVYRFASRGWLVSRIVGPLTPDALYGIGGVSFRAPPGARARFGTAKHGHFGRKVSRFEIDYLEQPGGGKLKINLDGKPWGVIDTNGPEKKTVEKTIDVPDGAHMLEIVTRGGSYSRAFGVVMERDVPGVVLDAIGVQGARVRFLDKVDDAQWAEQLKWRSPNLMIYEFGANESGDNFAYPMKDYHRTLKAVLEQGRKAVPEAGCLVLAAMDRAEKHGDTLRTMPVIPALVKEQKSASAEVGCAFWNTFKAMGGYGSMASWVRRGLGQADLTHPTGSGSEVLGSWIYRALMDGYQKYLKRKDP